MKEILVSGKYVALVSDEDFERVSKFNWFLTGNGYAFHWLPRNGGEKKCEMMHRFIMSAMRGQEVDHKNRAKLDNRRENLRFATREQNQQNVLRSSAWPKKGIRKNHNKDHGRWTARITVNKKEMHLGSFDDADSAAAAYDAAALKFYGPNAFTNATGAPV